MSRIVSAVQRAAASAHRIFEILDRVPSVPEPMRPVHPGRLQGELELVDVGFRYGTGRCSHDVNLKIRPGEMIGLVGPSGAGKSTLINLMCRFYDVTEGAILVDGVDIRSFPVDEYRRNIGIVLQEPFLFYGTIAENIAYGRPDATREEIIAAARAARRTSSSCGCPTATTRWSASADSRSPAASGSAISIARALLIDPRILILDEATSSVDTETERQIQEALDNLIRGPHDDRHRPPPEHAAAGRPAGRAGARPHCRSRAAPGAARSSGRLCPAAPGAIGDGRVELERSLYEHTREPRTIGHGPRFRPEPRRLWPVGADRCRWTAARRRGSDPRLSVVGTQSVYLVVR